MFGPTLQRMTSEDSSFCSNTDIILLYVTSAFFICLLLALFIVVVFLCYLIPSRRKVNASSPEGELLHHAVITGGSSGIGLAIATELVRKQCKFITLLARGEKKLEEAKESLEKYAESVGSDTKISFHTVDVANAEAITEIASRICNGLGTSPSPSILFNVAGTSSSGRFLEMDLKEFERLMSINYLGRYDVFLNRSFAIILISSRLLTPLYA